MSAPAAPKSGYTFTERASFRRDIENLNSKWPKAEEDILGIVSGGSLVNDPGDAIPNLDEFSGRVFKRRVLSTDLKDGKRGGFRLIYLVSEDCTNVELVAVYCKKEQATIHAKEILPILVRIEDATRLVCVEIVTEPDSAQVWLGTEFIDYAPCTLQLPKGNHVVTCRIPPDRVVEHSFDCDGTADIELRIVIP